MSLNPKPLHLWTGIAGFIVFLGTGMYMRFALDGLSGMEDLPRALYRSGHIYLLFASLLNVLLGISIREAEGRFPRWLQSIGSLLLLLAPLMFLLGFVFETPLGVIDRPVTRLAIFFSTAGVLAHGVVAVAERMKGRG